MEPDVTPTELLEDAVDILETDGWVRGQFWQHGKGYCAVGALQEATTRKLRQPQVNNHVKHLQVIDTGMAALRHLMSTLLAEGKSMDHQDRPPRDVIVDWNDLRARDKYEVTDMFRLAAKKAQA